MANQPHGPSSPTPNQMPPRALGPTVKKNGQPIQLGAPLLARHGTNVAPDLQPNTSCAARTARALQDNPANGATVEEIPPQARPSLARVAASVVDRPIHPDQARL